MESTCHETINLYMGYFDINESHTCHIKRDRSNLY